MIKAAQRFHFIADKYPGVREGDFVTSKCIRISKANSYGKVVDKTVDHIIVQPLIRARIVQAGLLGDRDFSDESPLDIYWKDN